MTNILIHRIGGSKPETKFDFGKNGNFTIWSTWEINSQWARDIIFSEMDDFLKKYFSVSWAKESETGYYLRFTSDKNEFFKIKAGIYTNSINHTNGCAEKGISVSRDMSYAVLGYDYFYIVSGKIIGFGSDGEPLLEASSMKKHSVYKSVAVFVKNEKKKEEKKKQEFLEWYGWTKEQLHDLLSETLYHKCKKQYINEDGQICDFSYWGINKQKIESFE